MASESAIPNKGTGTDVLSGDEDPGTTDKLNESRSTQVDAGSSRTTTAVLDEDATGAQGEDTDVRRLVKERANKKRRLTRLRKLIETHLQVDAENPDVDTLDSYETREILDRARTLKDEVDSLQSHIREILEIRDDSEALDTQDAWEISFEEECACLIRFQAAMRKRERQKRLEDLQEEERRTKMRLLMEHGANLSGQELSQACGNVSSVLPTASPRRVVSDFSDPPCRNAGEQQNKLEPLDLEDDTESSPDQDAVDAAHVRTSGHETLADSAPLDGEGLGAEDSDGDEVLSATEQPPVDSVEIGQPALPTPPDRPVPRPRHASSNTSGLRPTATSFLGSSDYLSHGHRSSTPTSAPTNLENSVQQVVASLGQALEGAFASAARAATQANSTSSPMANAPFRLQPMEIKPFDGTITDWPDFWDLFETAVHKQPYADVVKLTHLKSALTGEAARTLTGISCTNSNYHTAVQLLQERYGKRDVIISALYAQLTNLPVSSAKPSDVQRTTETVDRILRQLLALGVDVHQQQLLVQHILSKLPKEVLMKLEEWRSTTGQPWDVTGLRSSLARYVDIRRNVHQSNHNNQSHQSFSERPVPRPRHPTPGLATAQSLVASQGVQPPLDTGQIARRVASCDAPMGADTLVSLKSNTAATNSAQGQRKRSPCVFCGGNHLNASCPQCTTVTARKQALLKGGRCFLCLRLGHMIKACPQRTSSQCTKCAREGHHHHLLCEPTSSSSTTTRSKPDARDFTGVTSTTLSSMVSGTSVRMHLARVQLKTSHGEILVAHVLLDSASNCSYITHKLAEALSLPTKCSELLSVSAFGSSAPSDVRSRVVCLNLPLKNGQTLPVEVNAVSCITALVRHEPVPACDKHFLEALPENDLAEPLDDNQSTSRVDILLGAEYFWDLVQGPPAKLPSGLYLVPTLLGLVATGKFESECLPSRSANTFFINTFSKARDDLSCLASCSEAHASAKPPDLAQFWELESIGIQDPCHLSDDEAALRHFHSTVQMIDGRYQVSWPWKSIEPRLPDNFALAVGRLRSIGKRFSKDPVLCQQYQDILQHQLDSGIIEKVSEATTTNLKHYLPHHPVVKSSSNTSKVRIVYDASARTTRRANSLNDCLHRGPNLLPNLCGVLLRFRMGPVAMIADIEKAFLQLSIHPNDRDVTRFVWYKDHSMPTAVDNNLEVYRFCRVPFGVVSSPFLLEASIRFHLQQQHKATADLIAQNIYVDNVLVSRPTPAAAIELYHESKSMFKAASMNLREWSSNSAEVLKCLPRDDIIDFKTVPVLGLRWDTQHDVCSLTEIRLPSLTTGLTKRVILHIVASVYDPMGWFAPVTILGKFLLRKLWQLQLGWDDCLSDPLLTSAIEYVSTLPQLAEKRVPRFVGLAPSDTTCQIHIFCDASQHAYAAAAYLRVCSGSLVTVSLLFAKTRLSPRCKKPGTDGAAEGISIPRLELLGVLIGHRLSRFITTELAASTLTPTIWTDSKCVLHWLKSDKLLSVFVENRLKELRQAPMPTYRYVASASNPADLPTRGISIEDLAANDLWWHGPAWLRSDLDQWPRPELQLSEDDYHRAQSEQRKSSPPLYSATLVAGEGSREKTILGNVDLTRFSTLPRLLRVLCWCLKFVRVYLWLRLSDDHRNKWASQHVLLGRILNRMSGSTSSTALDLQLATCLAIRAVQQSVYAEPLTLTKQNSLSQLNASLDETGILRCQGRLSNVQFSDARPPALLPNRHRLTRLIIENVHRQLMHAGVAHSLAQIRCSFWIPKGRSEVAHVLKQCTLCRRLKGPAFRRPTMPPLPIERVVRSSPFQYVGVDYFGPLYVTGPNPKVWICLFTCFAIRAVHLEYVCSLSTPDFIRCLRRFVSRRGVPSVLYSDNAAQFKLAADTLDNVWRKVFLNPSLTSYLASQGIQWKFAAAMSPWQGGVYERLVGLVKRALRKAIGRSRLSLDQLITFVTEAEGIVNTRPLTFVSGSEDVSDQVLTPAHFLTAGRKIGIPLCSADDDSDFRPHDAPSSFNIIQQWRRQQSQLDCFWQQWEKEYLMNLLQAPSSHRHPRPSTDSSPQVGEVVVIQGKNARGSWQLGRIIKVNVSSSDNAIRTAEVRTPSGIVTRPVNLLHPLEVRCEHAPSPAKPTAANSADTTAHRPKRAAAERAMENIARYIDA